MSKGIVLKAMERKNNDLVTIGVPFPVEVTVVSSADSDTKVVKFSTKATGYSVAPQTKDFPPGKHAVDLTLTGPLEDRVVGIDGEAMETWGVSVHVKVTVPS